MGTNRLGLREQKETEPPKEQIDSDMLAQEAQSPQHQHQAGPIIEIRTSDSENAAVPPGMQPKEVVEQAVIVWTETSGQQPIQSPNCAAALQTETITSPAYLQNKAQTFSSAHQNAFLGKRVQEKTWEIMPSPAAKIFRSVCLVEEQRPTKPNSLKSYVSAEVFDDFYQPGEEFTSLTATLTWGSLQSSLETHQAGQFAHLRNEAVGGADGAIIEEDNTSSELPT